MTINIWDYRREFETEKKEIFGAIEKVLHSGRLILGNSVKTFEEAFSNYCGVRYGVGVNSGTDALFLGLKALGIGVGDEVITVANTAIPTISAIVSTGAHPKFVDIDPQTYLMNVDQIEKAITRRTKCILPVHLFGQCVAMETVAKIAKKHGLKVVEDCAQSHGALYNANKAGSMSDLAAFSFYPTKILGGFGDGGMVITNDESIVHRLRRLRMYGMKAAYYSEEHGYNSRLDELHAEILLRKLTHLDEYIHRRRMLANRYNQRLAGTSILLPQEANRNTHAYYLYVCRHPSRDKIISELARRDIHVNISYPWPVHLMRGYQWLGYKEGDLPNTEVAAKEIFSLPMYPSLMESEQDLVCDTLLEMI